MLRNYLLDGAGDSAIDPAVARQVYKNMPLLINPQEWRVINKHIGRMIGVAERKPEIGQQYYYNLKKGNGTKLVILIVQDTGQPDGKRVKLKITLQKTLIQV